MGKKHKDETSLGRSLMRDKKGRNQKSRNSNSMRHVAELEDGQDFSGVKYKSVTEQTDIDSFLETADLAGIDFKAEKLDIKLIPRPTTVGVLTSDQKEIIKQIHQDNKAFLRIPRRPPWDRSMSAESLAEAERAMFLEWRRGLSQLQEKEHIVMTPYEKNIEFWRQLWRVIERSDVVVQIVDARNPLLFYCEDLCAYVKEVDNNKENLILVNKADFLTERQRQEWVKYFDGVGMRAAFFSAIQDTSLDVIDENSSTGESHGGLDNTSAQDEPKNQSFNQSGSTNDSVNETQDQDDLQHLNNSGDGNDSTDFEVSVRECQNDLDNLAKNHCHDNDHSENLSKNGCHDNDHSEKLPKDGCHDNDHSEKLPKNGCHDDERDSVVSSLFRNSSKLLNRKELIEVLTNFHAGQKLHPSYVTIGLIGYPNVGKSSTINSLLQEKKTSVSATPGKTKHFQTLFLNDEVLLCDCPGLVFPAFVATKQEMVISGILPIDQMRDHVYPMNLLLSLIPRHILEATYGINIPLPLEGEDPDRHPVSEEFLNAYGYMRGFMTQRGMPDHPRSCRYVLKDYICGKLLYCHCPPGEDQQDYHQFRVEKVRKANVHPTPQQLSVTSRKQPSTSVDEAFFNRSTGALHYKGRVNVIQDNNTAPGAEAVQKPWKVLLKAKRNSRQKARKKFAEFDL